MEVLTQAINISINLNCSTEVIYFKHIQALASAWVDILMFHAQHRTLRIKDITDVFVKQNHRLLNYDIYKGIIVFNEESLLSAYLYIT